MLQVLTHVDTLLTHVDTLPHCSRLLHNPVESDQELKKMTDKAATWLFYKFDLYMSEQSLLASLTRKHGLGLAMVFVKILYAAVSFGCFILTAEMFSIGDFKTYGSEWVKKLRIEDSYATEEKDKLFPKMVACEVKRWGASGTSLLSSLLIF